MTWRDLLYFSKGERRALLLLLFLISITCVLLRVAHSTAEEAPLPEAPAARRTVATKEPTVAKKPLVRSSANPSAGAKKSPTAFRKKPDRYPAQSPKYASGTVVELNGADTTALKKVPGIGTAFAKRIVSYRNLLGGYYAVGQLAEVYGIDEEKYVSLSSWFRADTSFVVKIAVNALPADSLIRHPYLSYKQAKVIRQLRKQKGRLSGWDNLHLLEEFNAHDIQRLTPYLLFD